MNPDRVNSRARAGMQRGAFQRFRAVCIVLAACVLSSAGARPALARADDGGEVARLSIDQLKRFYLWCGGAATDGQLDNGAIMQCSIFYEALKQRAFDGDFERLLAWSRANSSARIDKR